MAKKLERITILVSIAEKRLIFKTASAKGRSVGDFVRGAVIPLCLANVPTEKAGHIMDQLSQEEK
jgi:uncharacterized protein (DUF1778 family)